MKLLRLAPGEYQARIHAPETDFSYPFSAVLSIVSVLMFIFVGMNFGIDFAGGTLDGGEGQVRGCGSSPSCGPDRPKDSGLAMSRCRASATRPTRRLRFGSAARAATRLRKPRSRRSRTRTQRSVTSSAGSRWWGRAFRANSSNRGRSGVVVSIFAVLLYLWFRLRMAVRGRGRDRDHARPAVDGRLLLGDPARVQHDVHRGDSDHRGATR